MKHEFKRIDPELKIELKESSVSDIFQKELSDRIICGLAAFPHGVDTMSHDIEGIVQTSNSMALARTESDAFVYQISSRSASKSELLAARYRNEAFGELLHGESVFVVEYPGWEPDPDSKIFKVTTDAYKDLFNEKPEVTAIHAGLECGIVGEKCYGMDMVSFGPTIRGAHSVDERVGIKSVDKFWKLLVRVIEDISNGK